MRTCVTDWRGMPDTSKLADFYSIAASHLTRPILGNPNGKVLVGISSTVYFAPNGIRVESAYNVALWEMVNKYDAWLEKLTPEPNGYYAVLFDITKRGVLSSWLNILRTHFLWADGFHVDWFSAWSWAFPSMAPLDEKWDASLAALANALRKDGFLVVGQQFSLTSPILACNGAFWEQSPTSFRQTFASHAADLARFKEVTKPDPRPPLFVAELRDLGSFPQAYRDAMRLWAEANDIVVSFGRDGSAGTIL